MDAGAGISEHLHTINIIESTSSSQNHVSLWQAACKTNISLAKDRSELDQHRMSFPWGECFARRGPD